MQRNLSAGFLLLVVACSNESLRSEFHDEAAPPPSLAAPSVDPKGGSPRHEVPTAPTAPRSPDVTPPAFVPSLSLRAGGAGGTGNLDGTGSAARFSLPYSVTVDANGNVYVADQGNDAIRKITPDGVVTTLAVRLHGPSGIAVDAAGKVFVADTVGQRILTITPDGVVTTLAGRADTTGQADGTGTDATFFYPSAVAVDLAGNAFVADSINQTIRKITPNGVVTTFAGTAGASGSADGTGAAARFSTPEGVAVDALGNVYVGDTNNQNIRKITPDAVVTTLAGSTGVAGSTDGTGSAAKFSHPGGLVVDATGNVYVGDTYNQTVRKITAAGVVTTLAGQVGTRGSSDGTGADAHFDNPKGCGVDVAGNVYLADYGTNTVRKITQAGVVTTLAGAALVAGAVDGPGASASFDFASWDSASGIAVDAAGNAFVGDVQNTLVRRVTPNGTVSTIGGTFHAYGNADGARADARFREPAGIALDAAGNVFVADPGNRVIRKITTDGTVSTLTGTHLMGPRSIAIDTAGNLFVADQSFFGSSVVRISAAGDVTTLASTGLRDLGGIAVDSAGNVLVTSTTDQVIQRIGSDGVVTTLAGTLGSSGMVDGLGTAARFARPRGIAVDAAGNAYVTDADNHAVRRVTPEGIVTTVVGASGLVGTKLGALPASLGSVTGIAVTRSGNLVIGVDDAVLDVNLH